MNIKVIYCVYFFAIDVQEKKIILFKVLIFFLMLNRESFVKDK